MYRSIVYDAPCLISVDEELAAESWNINAPHMYVIGTYAPLARDHRKQERRTKTMTCKAGFSLSEVI
jgi:hypothetical protein